MISGKLLTTAALVLLSAGAIAQAPADGITMEMMPITNEQMASCRSQASGQLNDEQKTLSNREHQQDKDKMKQGAVTGVTGAATTVLSRKACWWCGGNNNGAETAAATGQTQRTDRNSDNVASTTAMTQNVGADAYQQCVAGIKGPEYVHFRQTGKIEPLSAFLGAAASSSPAPAVAAVAPPAEAAPAAAPAAASAANAATPAVQDTGDGKHFVLMMPGESDAHEVTLAPGSKNSYIEASSGDKYIVMPNGTITRIRKRPAAK